jgi:hypothetical protein
LNNAEADPTLGVIKVHIGDNVRAVRFAHVRADLLYASWEPVPAGVRTIVKPWTFGGRALRRWQEVFAELQLSDGTTRVISGTELPRDVTSVLGLPLEAQPLGYALYFDFSQHAHSFASYHDQPGGRFNTFDPLYWHPDGYGWNTHHIRNVDVGETPVCILAALTYARWINGADWVDIDNRSYTFQLGGGRDWNLYGGSAYFFVVAPDALDQRKSGRYHLVDRPLSIGTPAEFAQTTWMVPSSSGWQCSWARDGHPINEMSHPLLTKVEHFGISLRGYSQIPTGVFAIRRFSAQ